MSMSQDPLSRAIAENAISRPEEDHSAAPVIDLPSLSRRAVGSPTRW